MHIHIIDIQAAGVRNMAIYNEKQNEEAHIHANKLIINLQIYLHSNYKVDFLTGTLLNSATRWQYGSMLDEGLTVEIEI